MRWASHCCSALKTGICDSSGLTRSQGRDTLTISSAKLSSDGRSVFLQIPDLKPAMQMQLRYNVNAAAGKPLRGEVYHTINQLSAVWESNGTTERR